MKLLKVKQGTPEWHSIRQSAIGASDAAVIMGVSPYKTREQLINEKISGSIQYENAAMTFGKQNGAPARVLFELMSNYVVFPDMVYSHDKRFWQIASLDGIDMERKVIVEIKCANKKDHAIACENRVPEKYYPQVQHQISVCDLQSAFYFSYHKGEGKIVYVPRNEEYIQEMLKKELEFYKEMLELKYCVPIYDNLFKAVGW